MCVAARNCKNSPKSPIWEAQGDSKSFKFINVKILKKLVTSACYGKHVCLYLFATIFTLDKPIAVK